MVVTRSWMLRFLFVSVVLARTFTSAAAVVVINQRPIIGILTEQLLNSNISFIVASYVKFVECAGARVIPILSNSSSEELLETFNSINGVLFPGGGVSLSSSYYSQAGTIILDLAKKANDQGDYFPVWGTCLGFELMNFVQSGCNKDVISKINAEDICLTMNFTNAAGFSRMYAGFSADLMQWLHKENISFNNHEYGVTMDTFNSHPKLNQFYTVLSTSVDKSGKEFISSIEGKNYPFYAVQWHPEKAGFEWTLAESINHSQHAITAMQAAANFFVSEARRSSHKFSSIEEEQSRLIYAHTPTYIGNEPHYLFEQEYYF